MSASTSVRQGRAARLHRRPLSKRYEGEQNGTWRLIAIVGGALIVVGAAIAVILSM
jgi:hypothetical protein